MPDAKGIERASQPQHEGAPFEAAEVDFADGVFVYVVHVLGKPGAVSQEDAVSAANKLYDRVQGAPLPATNFEEGALDAASPRHASCSGLVTRLLGRKPSEARSAPFGL